MALPGAGFGGWAALPIRYPRGAPLRKEWPLLHQEGRRYFPSPFSVCAPCTCVYLGLSPSSMCSRWGPACCLAPQGHQKSVVLHFPHLICPSQCPLPMSSLVSPVLPWTFSCWIFMTRPVVTPCTDSIVIDAAVWQLSSPRPICLFVENAAGEHRQMPPCLWRMSDMKSFIY